MTAFVFHCRRFCQPDGSLLQSVADLLLDLSAGWFGLIVITPNFIQWQGIWSMILLVGNAVTGIVAFALAVHIRRSFSR